MIAPDPTHPVVTHVGRGVYLVDDNGTRHTVFVARSGSKWWASWNGQVFEGSVGGQAPRVGRKVARGQAHQPVTSPMPATVLKVVVAAGDRVSKGDTLLVVEAMKMELPIRAPGDGIVTAVRCREGELVQPDVTLVDLEAS